jgi:acetyl esterase/lipase
MAIAAQIVYLMLLSACFSVLAWGQTSPSSPTTEASLKEFLQSYVKRRTQHENKTTRYKDVFVDLNDDGQAEAVVYLTGGGW